MNEWISVKDKVPEKDCWVICSDGFDIEIMKFSIYTRYRKSTFNFQRDEIQMETITHWMPLPELPKNE